MELSTAIKERRSCRVYLPEPIPEETIQKILEAGIWAPSPANNQGWEFIVITGDDVKARIHAESVERKQFLFEKSGWKWMSKYDVGFLKDAPAIVCVVGDPKKTGADMFLEEGNQGYLMACSAAIQNMLLAAHSLGLGSLWFTLFDKGVLREILGIDPEKDPIALVLLGKPGGDPLPTPRKEIEKKATFMR